MKDKAKRALAFLRLLDENGQLSITNISVMVVIIKVAVSPELDLPGIAALLTVISGYNFKRYTQKPKESVALEDDVDARLTAIEESVTSLVMRAGLGNE